VNNLPMEKKLAVLAALVRGNSETSVEELAKVSRPTISRLALAFGAAARNLHNRLVRDLTCPIIECDEQFAFVGRRRRPPPKTPNPRSLGPVWTYLAVDRATRLIVSMAVGDRDQSTTNRFVEDVRSRLSMVPLIVTDGFEQYEEAIRRSFGEGIDYAQAIKHYYEGEKYRYEPRRHRYTDRRVILGMPDLDEATTTTVERVNATFRSFIGRSSRKTYRFSKKRSHHEAAWWLGIVHYNFCHIVRTIRVTPAMEAGLTDHPWDIVELLHALTSEPHGEQPVAVDLSYSTPPETHRRLPNGKGFLRSVPKPKLPRPAEAPTAPATTTDTARPPAALFDVPMQMSLFDEHEPDK
jgi:IS1 family transposase